jgi:hypothetical protein
VTRTTLKLGAAALVLCFAGTANADEPAAAPAESPAEKAAEKAPEAEPTLVLKVDSPRKVAIENVDTGAILCHSPCNVAVPAAARYRVAGSRPSETFVLDGRKGTANISVDPASKRGLIAGIAVGGAGVALLTAGIVVLSVAAAEKDETPLAGRDGTTTESGFTDAMYGGTVMVFAGIAASIWGGANVMNNWKTTVSGNVVRQLPPSRAQVPPAQALMIPIIGGSF